MSWICVYKSFLPPTTVCSLLCRVEDHCFKLLVWAGLYAVCRCVWKSCVHRGVSGGVHDMRHASNVVQQLYSLVLGITHGDGWGCSKLIQCTCVVGPVTGLLLCAKLRFCRQMHAVNIVARCPSAVAIFMPPLCLVVHPVVCFQTLPCYVGVAADSAGDALHLRCPAAFAWSCHRRGSHMGMSEAGWGCCEMGCCSCFVGP